MCGSGLGGFVGVTGLEVSRVREKGLEGLGRSWEGVWEGVGSVWRSLGEFEAVCGVWAVWRFVKYST